MSMSCAEMASPLGWIRLQGDGRSVTRLTWTHATPGQVADSGAQVPGDAVLTEAIAQLDAYFAGRLRVFDLPIAPGGSDFQKRVCAAMLRIPHGDTRTYGDLARVLGVTAQAVGQGCGGNPVPILIPCHRVLAAQGLGGFSGTGGIDSKVWLLRHEGAAGLLI